MCDIDGMFHQVHVNPEHRSFLKFLWLEGSNFEDKPESTGWQFTYSVLRHHQDVEPTL